MIDMFTLPIVLNSVDGVVGSKSHDFTIKLTNQLDLEKNKNYYIMLDSLTMAYSWYNLSSEYGNNTIRYSNDNGVTFRTITIRDGIYSYTALKDTKLI